MTQEEKIKDLEGRIAIMDADNSALCTDLEHWKKVAAGLKGRNKQLAERAEHYKQLDLEGDELYEKKIAECDDLKKQLEEAKQVAENLVPKDKYEELERSIENKNIFIEQLQDRIQKTSIEKSKLETDLSVKKCEITTLVNEMNELKKPWWKKLF